MYRAVLETGDVTCARFEPLDGGVELYTDADEFIAFVPYAQLRILLNEEVYEADEEDERSFM
jgi:hypothetical protein